MLYRNAPAVLMVAAVLCFSGCVCYPPGYPMAGVGAGAGCDCGAAPCDDCATCGHGPVAEAVEECATCKSGCGEVYWGEWTSDPPDCCDPCDNCGNWTGGAHHCRSCSPWAPFKGLLHLWGYRYVPECGTCGGCETCGEGAEMVMPEGYLPAEMETYETLEPPTPQPEPTTAASFQRPVRRVSHTHSLRR